MLDPEFVVVSLDDLGLGVVLLVPFEVLPVADLSESQLPPNDEELLLSLGEFVVGLLEVVVLAGELLLQLVADVRRLLELESELVSGFALPFQHALGLLQSLLGALESERELVHLRLGCVLLALQALLKLPHVGGLQLQELSDPLHLFPASCLDLLLGLGVEQRA